MKRTAAALALVFAIGIAGSSAVAAGNRAPGAHAGTPTSHKVCNQRKKWRRRQCVRRQTVRTLGSFYR